MSYFQCHFHGVDIIIFLLKTFYGIKQLLTREAEPFQYVEMQQKTLNK